MSDEFLHRLRKPPRPAFAARLRAQLARQSATPPPPRVPSRARTLLVLLLLGGTAFAITSVVMRGLPRTVLELYQDAIAHVGAGHTATSTHPAGDGKFLSGLRWGASWTSPPRNTSERGETTHSDAASPAGAPPSPASVRAIPSGSTSAGGAPLWPPQWPVVSVLTSWAAYPHVEAVADRVTGMHLDISVGNATVWRDWPQAMCSGKPSAPEMAFTFEPVGTVSTSPCPSDHLGPPSPVIAIPLGYAAVVLARSPLYGALDLTRREVFLALAKWVPDPARPGIVHENGSTVWRQIDPAQGPEPIQVMGPELASATGRSMIELLMEGGCDTYSWIAALKSTAPDKYARICRTVRSDGVYSEVSNLQASELLAEPNALGILGFGDLINMPGDGNLAVSSVDGVTPTPEDIESGSYPASRGIYLYVNRRRILRNEMYFFFPFAFSQGELLALPDPQRQAAEALY